jgi:hypothetical protein
VGIALPIDMLKNLAESMPRRLQGVIDAKGFATIQKFEILNFSLFAYFKKLLFAFD